MRDWAKSLEETNVFVSILCQDTISSAVCHAQMLCAKLLKKPMLYIVSEDTDIPEEYTKDVEHLCIIRTSSNIEGLNRQEAHHLIELYRKDIEDFANKIYGDSHELQLEEND